MPETTLPGALCFETLVEAASEDFEWPSFDENTASSLCYSSGTTGNPKGVLYSHRSTVLHAMSAALPDVINVAATDTTMPVVPMFHVNAWGFPYFTPMMGAKLVLPGPLADGASIHALLEGEAGHHLGRGADGVARPARPSGGDRQDAHHRQAAGDRRLGHAAGDDRDLPRALRRRGATCLGDDRDVAARHHQQPHPRHRGRDAGAVLRPPGQAGTGGLRRRDEDRRRRRQRPPRGRGRLRHAQGARALGVQRLLPGHRLRHP